MKRFSVHYQVTCYEKETIDEKLRWLCLEQSVELPEKLVSQEILKKVVGQISGIEPQSARTYRVKIDWPLDIVGDDQTQFLNVLFGNISLKRGIKITSVDWHKLGGLFEGPMFGMDGIRRLFGISDRPMACGVLKPMGLSADELAEQATQFALGGIDMIKDDHGLANQKYAPFEERVSKISEALQRAMDQSGTLTHYFPNVTATGSKMKDKCELAADLGATGVLVMPHLCGYESMYELTQLNLDLPIIAHPAFSGTLVTDSEHGFTPAFLYGELIRAFGADFTVYPNTGGRFSFSPQECLDLNDAARKSDSPFKKTFPMPGGGMKRETIPDWIQEYGNETVFLMGASMLEHPDGIQKAAKEVTEILKS